MKFVSYLMIFSLITLPNAGWAQPEGKVGLVPLFSGDEGLRDQEQRQMAQLQKRFEQQWGMRVELLLDGWTAHQIKLQAELEDIQEAARLLQDPMRAPGDATLVNRVERITRFRSEFASSLPLGALLSELDLALARWAFRSGDKERAVSYLVEAVQRHPQRRLNFLSDDWDDPINEVEALVRERATRDLNTCQISWEGKPASEVSVNGFNLSIKGDLKLVAGRSYALEWQGRNRAKRQTVVLCVADKAIKIASDMGWQSDSLPSLALLNFLRREKQWGSVLLSKYEGSKAAVWSYSDRTGIEKTDANKMELNPLTSIKDLAYPVVPVRNELPWDPSASTTLSDKMETSKGRAWYNDWKVWAIGGGLIAGAAVVLFASKGDSQPHWKILVE